MATSLPYNPNVIVKYSSSNFTGQIECVFGETNSAWRILSMCPAKKSIDSNFVEYAAPVTYTGLTVFWTVMLGAVIGSLVGYGFYKCAQKHFFKDSQQNVEDFDAIGPSEQPAITMIDH